jgi:hypothetical protein
MVPVKDVWTGVASLSLCKRFQKHRTSSVPGLETRALRGEAAGVGRPGLAVREADVGKVCGQLAAALNELELHVLSPCFYYR